MPVPTRALAALALGTLLLPACAEQIVQPFDLPPQAQILQPLPGAVIDAPGITFAGQVEDNDPAASLAVVWTSDLVAEPLWQGNPDSSGYTEFAVQTLPVGTHLVTLRVTDGQGQSDAATITLTVTQAIAPPLVTINLPQGGFLYYGGSAIAFEGVVTDAEGEPGVHPVEWSSDQLGPLYSGVTTADGFTEFSQPLPEGTHLLQLRTYDDTGTLGSDSVTITVGQTPVGQLDQDGDGYCPDGVDADGDGRCADEKVTGPDTQDCDDFVATVCPGCPEICDGFDDNDCDGVVDPQDQDLDGDGWTLCEGDCDDSAPWNAPDLPEVCDGRDNDCDGAANAGPNAEADADGDGVRTCADCDDAQPLAFPGNLEVCDAVDNDCDAQTDEGFDLDGDGVTTCAGDCADNQPLAYPLRPEVCDGIDNDCDLSVDEGFDLDGDGVTTCAGDCDDAQPLAYPSRPEVCDGIDNDCDGFEDEGFDLDGDSFTTCEGDCNDVQPASFPGNAEICDGIDNDCDFAADEGFDLDGDGWTTCAGDCNDASAVVYPFRAEGCDGVDNDCDGLVDEGFDGDGDGWTSCAGDCNNANPLVYPNAPEVCDTVDNDCDGRVNEDQAGPYEMWETSANSPGYELSSLGPQLVFGTGACSIGGFLRLQPGAASVAGVFSAPNDLWDIFTFDTDITSNLGAWLAFLSSGQGLPASCTTGSVSWSAAAPISVTVLVGNTPYSGTGASGSVGFNLSILQLFDVDYRVTVQPLASWTSCNFTYTLNFLIP